MSKMFNRARMSVTSTGTGALTLGGGVLGYQSFAQAGIADGDVVSYTIEDGANWEIGTGTYTASGTTLSRTVTQSYNGTTYGTSPISVTTSAQVFITILAADVITVGGALGTPSSITLTNGTGLPLTTGVTGTLPVANGGTGVTTSTGSGSNVLSTSPTLVTPVLGTPTSVTLTNATGLPLTTGVTGTLPVANGGTGTATAFTSGSVVFAGASGTYSQDNANFFWDDNNNRLGLGKTNPITTLDVNGSISAGYSISGQEIVVYNGDTTNRQRIRLTVSGTDGVISATRAAGTVPNMLFQIDNVERMRLSSSGTLNIVGAGTAGSTQAVSFSGSAPAGAMTLDASGNLLLSKIAFNNDTPFITGANISSGSNAMAVGSTGSSIFYFFTNNTRRMDVSATAATLSIGTSAATNPGSIQLYGSTSGSVTVNTPAVAGTTTFTLPGSNGTNGYALTTNGSGVTSWGVLGVAGGGTGVTTSTGSGSLVLSTSPTITTPTITGYTETAPTAANSGTSTTISILSGTVLRYTMTGNCTFTMPTAVAGQSFIAILTQDGTGGRTAVFTGVKWPSGSAPSLTTTATTGRDILTFVSDGTHWYGTAAQAFA